MFSNSNPRLGVDLFLVHWLRCIQLLGSDCSPVVWARAYARYSLVCELSGLLNNKTGYCTLSEC